MVGAVLMLVLGFVPTSLRAEAPGYRVALFLGSCDDGSPHIFDCRSGSDVCGGMIGTNQHCAGIPILANFTLDHGYLRIRFTRNGINLINSSGMTLIAVPLSANDLADRNVTLYETVSDPDNESQEGAHPLVLRRSETSFDTVRIVVTPKDFNAAD